MTNHTFNLHLAENYFRVECLGHLDKGSFLALLEEIKGVRSKFPSLKKCWVDLSQAKYTVTILDLFELGELSAEQLVGIKLFTLLPLGSQKLIYEDATNNRGLDSLVSDDQEAGLKWLLV